MGKRKMETKMILHRKCKTKHETPKTINENGETYKRKRALKQRVNTLKSKQTQCQINKTKTETKERGNENAKLETGNGLRK